MSEENNWIQRQQQYNLWLWGIVALFALVMFFIILILYASWLIGGMTGLYVASGMLSIIGIITFAVVLIRWLTKMIQDHTLQVVRATTLSIIAHQANDDKGEVMRHLTRTLADARHDDNQVALAIHRQADRMARERLTALSAAAPNAPMLQEDFMKNFSLVDEEYGLDEE